MAEKERKKEKRNGFFRNFNSNGLPNLSEQSPYNPANRDWEHRKDRIRDITF